MCHKELQNFFRRFFKTYKQELLEPYVNQSLPCRFIM